jgi:hypothetical protein
MARLDYAATTKTASREGLLLKVGIGPGALFAWQPLGRVAARRGPRNSPRVVVSASRDQSPKPSHLGEISDSTPNELLPISQSFPAYLAIDSGPGPWASPRMAELPPFEKRQATFGLSSKPRWPLFQLNGRSPEDRQIHFGHPASRGSFGA